MLVIFHDILKEAAETHGVNKSIKTIISALYPQKSRSCPAIHFDMLTFLPPSSLWLRPSINSVHSLLRLDTTSYACLASGRIGIS